MNLQASNIKETYSYNPATDKSASSKQTDPCPSDCKVPDNQSSSEGIGREGNQTSTTITGGFAGSSISVTDTKQQALSNETNTHVIDDKCPQSDKSKK